MAEFADMGTNVDEIGTRLVVTAPDPQLVIDTAQEVTVRIEVA